MNKPIRIRVLRIFWQLNKAITRSWTFRIFTALRCARMFMRSFRHFDDTKYGLMASEHESTFLQKLLTTRTQILMDCIAKESGPMKSKRWNCKIYFYRDCTNSHFEMIHCRAARVIFNLPRDMPSVEVRKVAKWDSLFDMYKVKIATLIYNIYNRTTPTCMENLIHRRKTKYDLRNQHKISVSRFETYYMKN